MPNHFHGIVRVVDFGNKPGVTQPARVDVTAAHVVVDVPVVETSGRTSLPWIQNQNREQNQTKPEQPPRIRPKSVSSFMAGVKSIITKRINEIRNTPGAHVLQYRFHDHIVRNEHEL
jgi:hypothetical protein